MPIANDAVQTVIVNVGCGELLCNRTGVGVM